MTFETSSYHAISLFRKLISAEINLLMVFDTKKKICQKLFQISLYHRPSIEIKISSISNQMLTLVVLRPI